ncbi:Cell envelope-associated transcriptional attenuator LytR-CpsA-PsR [Serinicoccus hydrothermalis]|uniref:Cell envelope-associated transcriptional attenuator LytR-CpsA-PsR n=1 Tax=Serinicoccus hydrothermalis TaxID=1758689 RepID=A0A1B1N7K5_9MICO|nr:LCP family protein [Serinicoccus hydrothermalis]ANS77409.1 Cell envelope-associated transcriptional attenuator LytR-CpsA-PsR [Serinicoccus hydrothermalis]
MRTSLLTGGLVVSLLLTGCGPDDGNTSDTAPTTAAVSPEPTPTGPEATTATAGPAPEGTAADRTTSATTSSQTSAPEGTSGAGTAASTEAGSATTSAERSSEPAPDSPLADGPVTILLVGTDSRDPGSMTGASDTIMLMHLPEDREEVALVSLTRDMWVDIPGMGQGKINAAFALGGTDTLRRTVSDLLGGVEIDYVVQSNFQGFINLTRWLEGFEVDNQHASSVTVGSTGRQVVFDEGQIWLENTDGLIYSRQRKGLPLGDLDRTERQRAVIIGMMGRLQERLADDPRAFPELVEHLHDNVKVTGDLDLRDFVALTPLLRELDPEDTLSLMVPITGFDMIQGQSVNIVDREQTAALGTALREDSLEEYVERWGSGYAP